MNSMSFNLSLDLLETLCRLPGISGFEHPVAQAICASLEAMPVECYVDRIGNVVAHLPGEGPRVLMLAHMDEVGYMVNRILPDGFLQLERVGGAAIHTLQGAHMQVWTDSGSIPGVVGIIPPHIQSDHRPDGLDGYYVDLGMHSIEAVHECGIEIGSPVTVRPVFQKLENRVAAKALDDRAGCALLVELARALVGQPLACDLTLAFVAQEENLLVGGLPVANQVKPDWVLGVDATLTYDTPDLTTYHGQVALGSGPAIKIMDHLRGRGQGLIAHLPLRKHIEQVAKTHGITLQREIAIGISTAASPLVFAGEGLPVAAVSFPLRYSHSPAEVVDLNDLNQTLQLLYALVMQPWKQ